MKVLFVVTSNPFSKDFLTLKMLVRALSQKAEVSIFFSGNGAYYIQRPGIEFFKELGVRLLFCAHSAHQRGILTYPEFCESSSTYNLSKLSTIFDKILVFN
ncbi:MAG: DsrE family protein [Aquificaceae bacterium]